MTQQQILDRADALRRSGRLSEARDLYLNLLRDNPDDFAALHFLGIVRAQQGFPEESAELIAAAIRLRPDWVDALSNLALVLNLAGRFSQAIEQCDKVIQLTPDNAEAWNNRGVALQKLNRAADAVNSFDRALATEPGFAEAWNNRGNALAHLRHYDDALASYAEALRHQSAYTDAWVNRGNVLKTLSRFGEALTSYARALAIQPNMPSALVGRGIARWNLGQCQSAIRDLERAAQQEPDRPYIQGDLLHRRMQAGLWDDLETQIASIDAGVREGRRVIEPFSYQAISHSPTDLQSCSRIYVSDKYPHPTTRPRSIQPNTDTRIRVGYVSGEFREQATAFLMARLYELHDRSTFEIIAWDNGHRDNSPLRKRLEAAFDKVIPIASLSDGEAAEEIASAHVDILVNLNGYFGAERTGLFALRPAPIQINYLGFPATMGASWMDYIIADRFVIPEAERCFYDEEVVYLPDCYQVNDCRRRVVTPGASRIGHGLPTDGFIFCNFNQSYKLTPESFDLWMHVLLQVEGSVFWLLESNSALAINLRREAERRGVAGERLIFAPVVAQDDHLARLALADLFLDGLPYNAHTTASDALWAGVPLVTCTGSSFAGKVATSLLHAVNLPELVCETPEAFEALAVSLAGDPARHQTIREKLAANRTRAPLFDTERYCRHLESAYRTMWDKHRKGLPPESFSVIS